jgi:kynurenine formamidase
VTVAPERVELLGRPFDVYDISDTLSNATSANEPNPHEIEYLDHAETVPIAERLYGVGREHFRGELAWAYERVSLTTHSGTHLDAPWHYAPDGPGGTRAMTVDQVPLSWCTGRGVLLDFSAVPREAGATADDVQRELERIGHELRPLDVVLVRTDASRHFGEPMYHNHGCGLRRSATQYLVERGVRLIGVDAWTLDRPIDVMAAAAQAGDDAQLWESHYYGSEAPYLQLERLVGLASLPAPTGFFVIALPAKIEAASAGWTRVVAAYEVTDR